MPPAEQSNARAAEMFLRAARLYSDKEESSARVQAADPVQWVWESLGYELKGVQPEIMRAACAGEDVAVRTGHKCGKSFTLACATLWWLGTKEHSKVLTTAPGERQLKHILWAEIGHLYRRWSQRGEFELTESMHLYHKVCREDWFALGIYSSDSANIEGFHTRENGNLLIIVDEAKAVGDEFFSAVASMQGQRLLASVPPLNSQGYFVKCFRENRDLWRCFHLSSLDSPFVEAAWLEKMETEWIKGSVTWQAKIEGEFPKSTQSNLVVLPEMIERSQERWERNPEPRDYRPVIGVDVARYGDDATVGWAMHNFRLANLFVREKQDLMATVGVIRELAAEEAVAWNRLHPKSRPMKPEEVPVWVDDTGLGGGVTDRLIELDQDVTGINFGERAERSDLYLNRRSELWFDFAAALERIELPPNHAFEGVGARLAAELSMPQFAYTSTGRKLESKDAIKKRLGRSPDLADAAVLANAAAKFYADDAEEELVSHW